MFKSFFEFGNVSRVRTIGDSQPRTNLRLPPHNIDGTYKVVKQLGLPNVSKL